MLPRSIMLVVAATSNVSLGGAFTLGSRYFATRRCGASLASRRQNLSRAWSRVDAESGVNVSIEYCSACRWLLRSVWLSSEILTTFANEPNLRSIELRPQSPPLTEGGQFVISAAVNGENITLWDRKIEGAFPEAKEIKQLIRNLVNPELDLGHSDKTKDDTESAKEEDCMECKEEQDQLTPRADGPTVSVSVEDLGLSSAFESQNFVSIEYSTGLSVDSSCNEIYHATYFASELLALVYARNSWWKQHKDDEKILDVPIVVDRVTLVPDRDVEDRSMKIYLGEELLYEQSGDNAASITSSQLRELVLAQVKGETNSDSFEMLDDDEAEEMRKYFGVF
mmetsp:Transcript_27885/g.66395  ORF Transcript_27885/g.66395 Transcript_27885/m.66395 type:complete len:338 (-) Transcript_27885:165-1178(-)